MDHYVTSGGVLWGLEVFYAMGMHALILPPRSLIQASSIRNSRKGPKHLLCRFQVHITPDCHGLTVVHRFDIAIDRVIVAQGSCTYVTTPDRIRTALASSHPIMT